MIAVVDTAVVASDDLDEYLGLLRTRVVPTMTGAGATLTSCRTTAADIGEPVEVQVTWSCPDLAAWNEIRRALVLDPGYYEYAAALAGLRLRGTRRFAWPVAGLDPSMR